MNAIFSKAVNDQVQKLRKGKCCGCEVNHLSQRRHDCIMMSEEEGWIMHSMEAIAQIIERGILWKQFTESIRVMKLDYHEDVTRHFQNLAKDHEVTLEFLILKEIKVRNRLF